VGGTRQKENEGRVFWKKGRGGGGGKNTEMVGGMHGVYVTNVTPLTARRKDTTCEQKSSGGWDHCNGTSKSFPKKKKGENMMVKRQPQWEAVAQKNGKREKGQEALNDKTQMGETFI